jgi:DNA-binding SARP family transcriptional activator
MLGQDAGGPEECRVRLYRAYVFQQAGACNSAKREIDRLGQLLVAEDLDPFFLVPDIIGLPALKEVISQVPGADHTIETLQYEVDRILLNIDSDEPDEPREPEPVDNEAGDLPGRVSVQGFGAAKVEIDGREVTSGDWRSKIAKELFFLLAYHARPISKGEIIAALWPDKEPAKAESSLKSSLFRARRALHQDWIVYEDGRYRLAPHGQYHFDVSRFKELLKIAERMPQDANLGLRHIEEAVDLYNGDFLSEFYSEWCVSERAILERRFMQSASVVARHHAELGNHDRAARVGDKMLSVDPYNEEALGILLTAYAAAGDYAAGEHRYREYRNVVETELGEPPSVNIEMVYQSLYLERAGERTESVGLK